MTERSDYRWLTSQAAQRWLAEQDPQLDSLRLSRRARRWVPAARARLLVELRELRRRAAAKFAAAGRMYFTGRSLEQATDERVAAYKAARMPGPRSADLCCGIGGDLLALANRAASLGIELDPIVALLAQANARALGRRAAVVRARAEQLDLRSVDDWHIDPDRRAAGRRTIDPARYQPDVDQLRALLAGNPHAAVKLAPATRAPLEWEQQGELQWIGSGGECRQQVAWLGRLARHAGRRSVAIVPPCPTTPPLELWGRRRDGCDEADRLGRYLFDPHPAVLAAGLVPALAAQLRLARIDPRSGYLTGEHPVRSPAAAAFELLETVPLDRKQLRRRLRHLDVGPVEIKKRAVPVDPQQLRRALALTGQRPAVLVLTPHRGRYLALIARRLD